MYAILRPRTQEGQARAANLILPGQPFPVPGPYIQQKRTLDIFALDLKKKKKKKEKKKKKTSQEDKPEESEPAGVSKSGS